VYTFTKLHDRRIPKVGVGVGPMEFKLNPTHRKQRRCYITHREGAELFMRSVNGASRSDAVVSCAIYNIARDVLQFLSNRPNSGFPT